MNIFVLDRDPILAARMYCDKHVPKMCVELLQQLGSAVIRHGATEEEMPLTKKGTPLKGGYHKHPCTLWCGDSRTNYEWAACHAIELCREYLKRYQKVHFCSTGILHLAKLTHKIPEGGITQFAQAMPDEYRNSDAVVAYRDYYHSKSFACWKKGSPKPGWFRH